MLATTIQITNNPPHTTHTQKTTLSGWLCGQPPPSRGGGRQHGVEREPDSVLVRCKTIFMPNPKTRTHTHHPHWVVNTCRHKKTNNTTQQATLRVSHKWAP